jgi:hypothetical protein
MSVRRPGTMHARRHLASIGTQLNELVGHEAAHDGSFGAASSVLQRGLHTVGPSMIGECAR